MITVDVVVFVALIVAALIVGATLSWRLYAVNTVHGGIIDRCHRDADINDAADMAETSRDDV